VKTSPFDNRPDKAALDRALLGPHLSDPIALRDSTWPLFYEAHFPDPLKYAGFALGNFLNACDDQHRAYPHPVVCTHLKYVAAALYNVEQIADFPPIFPNMTEIEFARYLDCLIDCRKRAADPDETLQTHADTVSRIGMALLARLPPFALDNIEYSGDESLPTVPLLDLITDLGSLIEEITASFVSTEAERCGLFRLLRQKLQDNERRISTQRRSTYPSRPGDYSGPPQQIVDAYLAETPLVELFSPAIPFQIPNDDRGEHTAIIAGTGWGKTQLLQSMIAADLQTDDPPGCVVIDSTGAMVQRIQRLALFNDHLRDRLLIIDPEVDPVPALNPFDVSNPRFETYDEGVRERMQGEVINLFNYVFSTVKNPLSTRMETAFAFMVRLMLLIPGANIRTLLDLLNDEPPKGDYALAAFKPHIDKLDPTAQLFFKAQYYTGRDGGLREQIRARVFDILRVPAFERMFSTVNKVDFFTELNRGTIVLVNTSENLLADGSATFGRYIIARVMAAAFERAPIPPKDRRQTFLIIDEAAPYFDEQFEKLLNRVRQYKLGVVIAFQNLEQASGKLRSTIASSTAIKYAGGTGDSDARWLAREMRCDSEFIKNQKRDARPPKWTQFACHVRNFTDRAVSLTVPFFAIENMARMSDAEHVQLLNRNHARVAAPGEIQSNQEPTPRPLGSLPQKTPVEVLAEAYTELAAAMTRADWTAVADLKNRTIPALESQIAGAAEPAQSAVPPIAPTPRNEEPSGDIEPATDWR